jgi:hypothetical protein
MDWLWHLGLWDSIGICLGFSLLVVGADEWMHARRRRQREGQGSAGH